MLEIRNLTVSIADKVILKELSLTVEKGTVQAIMGMNGSGKSTLCNVIAGREEYEVVGGEILYEGENLLEMAPHVRAGCGVFMAFQYPTEVPGVNTLSFLRTAINALRKQQGKPPEDSGEILRRVKAAATSLGCSHDFLNRPLNVGFSGGEKKRMEMLQMLALEPSMALLDETDSGLDIDALKHVARGIRTFANKERTVLIITHYQRLLEHIVPDRVHLMMEGKIIRSGDKTLAVELEQKGYKFFQ